MIESPHMVCPNIFIKTKSKKVIFLVQLFLFNFHFLQSQEIRSFQPLITDNDAIILPGAEGKWLFDFSEGDTLSIQKKGDNFYHLQTAKSSIRYEAGSPLYHKDNFCYLGREHIQFYNPKTQTITITYDYNTADFKKLISDTSVYTPKVISVKLKN